MACVERSARKPRLTERPYRNDISVTWLPSHMKPVVPSGIAPGRPRNPSEPTPCGMLRGSPGAPRKGEPIVIGDTTLERCAGGGRKSDSGPELLTEPGI